MKILVLLISNFICSVSIGIASVLVPWTLSETDLGSLLLSSSSAIASLMMFFLFPYIGLVVEKNSKYKLFLIQISVVFFISLLSSVLFKNKSIMLIV